jgi:SWI/SNF-related matrix-associated actin-dependent regulator of chromatin subfamily A-like protein 1
MNAENAYLALFNYQTDGVEALLEFLCKEPHGALLADPPGGGKTAMAIACAKELMMSRVLVICPASLRLNWAREFAMWYPHLKSCVLATGTDTVPCEEGFVVITSYTLASQGQHHALSSHQWDMLIMDEAHALRSPSSNQSRTCLLTLWRAARYRLAITGTPVPNGRAKEAWSLFSRLAPDLFGSWKPFKEKYCIEVETRYGIDWPRSKNLEELGALARERFMVRRSRAEIMSELPELIRCVVPLEVSRVQVEETQGDIDVEATVQALLSGTPSWSDSLSTARKELGKLKAEPAWDYIMGVVLEEVFNCVVFCHHKDVFEWLFTAFTNFKVPTVRVSGKTSMEERQQAVDDFQAKSARVFLASITAANSGITLTASSTVVFVEADWTPSINEQAEGRVLRVGQSEICRAIYLVVPDSLDDVIDRSLKRKRRDIRKVMQEA